MKENTKRYLKVLTILSSPNLAGGTPYKIFSTVKLSRHEHFVYFYSKGYNYNIYDSQLEAFKMHCRCYEGYNNKRNIFKHISKILEVIDNENIEIVQSCFVFGEILAGIIKYLRPDVKLLLTFENLYTPPLYKRVVEHIVMKKLDGAVYISREVRKQKESLYKFLKKKNGAVIYNGAEDRDDKGSFCNKFKHFSVLYVGELTEVKNHKLLIEAADLLVNGKGIKNIYFHFIGKGNLREALESKIKRLKLCKHVVFHGYSNDIGSALKNTDIYAHPCYMEGFGIAVAEAMLKSKVSLVPDSGALAEIIENKVTGFVLPTSAPSAWADKILHLSKEPEMLRSIGDKAKKVAESKFTIDIYVKNIDVFYDNL